MNDFFPIIIIEIVILSAGFYFCIGGVCEISNCGEKKAATARTKEKKTRKEKINRF